ncbi:MAG TPA: hypothetical protein VF406_11310, partial [Thermodesulfobacteriota bacterium]
MTISNDELRFLIRASYPIIYIVSAEEARVEHALRREVLPGLGGAPGSEKRLITWSITEGFADPGRSGASPGAGPGPGRGD